MEAPVRVRSHAKLNLTLDVTGIKDGYHLLDSFVASVSLADDIALRPRADEKIVLAMHGEGCEGIPPAGNAALRAAERFRQKYGTRGAEIEIEKHIPVGAGLGGSSADAAGVLRGMSALYGIKDGAVMKELADDGMTMVIVTHELGFAREVATRVLFMDGGLVLEDAPPEEFFGNPKNPRLQDFLSKVL